MGEDQRQNRPAEVGGRAAELGQRAQRAEEAAGQDNNPKAAHYYGQLAADFPPPPSRWEAIKATAGEWVESVTERFSAAKPEEIKAAPQRAPVQAEARPENGPPPPGRSVEEIAQNKALAAQLAEIQDPEQRAEAQRLLSEIRQEAAARQPRRQREQALELEP